MLLALYNCIMIPLNVAFSDSLTTESISTRVQSIVDLIIDILFLTDIIFNFRTTFINPKTNMEVTDTKRIALNYVSS